MTGPHHTSGFSLDASTRGFSLFELVVSVAVMTTIMLGLGSAMLIAGRALPQGENAATQTIAASEALERMTAELQYATAVTQRSATLIEFTVPDRSGDGVPETIRYEWAGTPGAPLIRQYNATAPIAVLSDVHEFALAYNMETISTEIPQGNESSEILLVEYNASQDYANYPIRNTQWYGQYFHPALPADTINWKVTRVRFYAKRTGPGNGEARVQLQLATAAGLPSGTVLEEKTLYESALPSEYAQYEMPYSQVAGLPAEQGLCLVFEWVSGQQACELLGQSKNAAQPQLALLRSSNQGQSWTTLTNQLLLFSVYGTVTTVGTPQVLNQYYIRTIGIQLSSGADSQSAVQTAVRTLNRPEVSQ